MSNPRIELSQQGFLLYAELVYYCTERQTPEKFDTILAELSKKVSSNLQTREGEYLMKLARDFNKKEGFLKIFYDKITTEIIKQRRSKLSINPTSDIVDCFQYIEKLYPNETSGGIRKFITSNVESCFEPKEKSKQEVGIEPNPSIGDMIDLLAGTTWYIYYHEYDVKPKTQHTVISRLVLQINSSKDVHVYEREPSQDFKGEIDPSCLTNSSILIINFERKKPRHSSKKLQLRIILEDVIADDTILLGQYIDSEQGNKIVSGTFVLENITKNSRQSHIFNTPREGLIASKYFRKRSVILDDKREIFIIQVKLVYYSDWERHIPGEIAEYLLSKWKNHTKTASLGSNSNLAGLGGWQKDERNKERKEKYNSNIEYDCFLITPIGSIEELEERVYFKEINDHLFDVPSPTLVDVETAPNLIYDASKVLRSIYVNKIYYSPRIKLINEPGFSSDDVDSQSIVSEDIAAMQKSRFIVFIVPDIEQTHPHHTSAFIKIGWAMQQGKPVIIFPLAPNLLPVLLLKSRINNIHISEPVSIKDIPSRMKNEFKQIVEP